MLVSPRRIGDAGGIVDIVLTVAFGFADCGGCKYIESFEVIRYLFRAYVNGPGPSAGVLMLLYGLPLCTDTRLRSGFA
jgi:hypothetical protein